MHSTFRWESGFTLVEMMIVLTLISILSFIATVTLGSSSLNDGSRTVNSPHCPH